MLVSKMKTIRYLLIMISILVTGSTFSSCAKDKMPNELEQEIISEFQKCFEQQNPIDDPQLYIAEYFGNYNGAHIFYIDSTNVFYFFPTDTKIIIKTEIEGKTSGYITLTGVNGQMCLWGYYDGLIYSIDKLHEAGFLTTKEVLNIWEKYCEYSMN